MDADNNKSLELHSGNYANILASVPENRLDAVLPLLELRDHYRLIDFACGNGLLAELLANRIASYEGVDFSSDLVNEANLRKTRKGLTNAIFHCMDIVSFCNRRTEEFDIVTAFDFSEHIDDKDFVDIFSCAYKILKHGGCLYIYTPNLDFFWEKMKQIGLVKQFPQHIAVRNHEHYIRLLKLCGFSPENIEIFRPPHFNIFKILHPLRLLPIIGRYFEAKLLIKCTR